MKRPSEITRERILKTAVRLFAERGYEATSIRTLAAKAHVNQAAINYHFKTKDGLYREVLRDAIHALTQDQLAHAQETQAMSRERALGEFVRQQLRPLSARDDVTRYIHILNWEAVRPTTVYRWVRTNFCSSRTAISRRRAASARRPVRSRLPRLRTGRARPLLRQELPNCRKKTARGGRRTRRRGAYVRGDPYPTRPAAAEHAHDRDRALSSGWAFDKTPGVKNRSWVTS